MAVASVTSFRTEPGRLGDHLALSVEALEHLRRLGMQAILIRCQSGADAGLIGMSVNHADNAEYARALETIAADEKWQEFWARAGNSGAASQVESSVYSDIDPGFSPAPDRPLGVLAAYQWRPKDGRFADFIGNVQTATPMLEGHGATVRTMQSLVGLHPMTVLVVTTFEDLAAYGAHADAVDGDADWQAFWAGVMADPTADLVRSGLYVNIGD